ncbi:PC-esterase domain-containing protein 1A-like [Cottoperca gobio]|uniref:PC-esterase domain-containing protein 1A-like n=1 Tax=Cottoperca gobio TaxID=56716 RepID=A0A6J2RHM9_COTGO|nr:PC-esterase domain-containing protein 1A-like [Cottoperca gobio]
MRTFVMQSQARQLLHNKFVLVLGGSVQRSMYKDLVLLLQRDKYLSLPQLKSKGEFSFERDSLVEGGRGGPMTNGTGYREVRQYRSDHHLLRFYFLTRIYSPYMESILEDLRKGLKPDVIVVSSCVWDITRYGLHGLEQYKKNLHKFFDQIKTIACRDCLILWTLAMPLAKKIKGGFLVSEVSCLAPMLCFDIIEANFYSSHLAEAYGLDVLDLHFHFRFSLQHRMPDGIHWDALAHRRISSLMLRHAAEAWGVDLMTPPSPPGQAPLQRCGLLQYQQSHRPDRVQHVPPNSDPLMHYSLQRHRYKQQNSAAAAGIGQFHPPPVRGFPAAGNYSRHYNPLPPANLWSAPQVYLQVRAPSSQMDSMFSADGCFRFRHHFQADDHCMRRRRPNFRTHPYPPHLPQVTPRHPLYRW